MANGGIEISEMTEEMERNLDAERRKNSVTEAELYRFVLERQQRLIYIVNNQFTDYYNPTERFNPVTRAEKVSIFAELAKAYQDSAYRRLKIETQKDYWAGLSSQAKDSFHRDVYARIANDLGNRNSLVAACRSYQEFLNDKTSQRILNDEELKRSLDEVTQTVREFYSREVMVGNEMKRLSSIPVLPIGAGETTYEELMQRQQEIMSKEVTQLGVLTEMIEQFKLQGKMEEARKYEMIYSELVPKYNKNMTDGITMAVKDGALYKRLFQDERFAENAPGAPEMAAMTETVPEVIHEEVVKEPVIEVAEEEMTQEVGRETNIPKEELEEPRIIESEVEERKPDVVLPPEKKDQPEQFLQRKSLKETFKELYQRISEAIKTIIADRRKVEQEIEVLEKRIEAKKLAEQLEQERVQKANLIPGTNILKPRNRDIHETDHEYEAYLRNYYEQHKDAFQKPQEIKQPEAEQEIVAKGRSTEEIMADLDRIKGNYLENLAYLTEKLHVAQKNAKVVDGKTPTQRQSYFAEKAQRLEKQISNLKDFYEKRVDVYKREMAQEMEQTPEVAKEVETPKEEIIHNNDSEILIPDEILTPEEYQQRLQEKEQQKMLRAAEEVKMIAPGPEIQALPAAEERLALNPQEERLMLNPAEEVVELTEEKAESEKEAQEDVQTIEEVSQQEVQSSPRKKVTKPRKRQLANAQEQLDRSRELQEAQNMAQQYSELVQSGMSDITVAMDFTNYQQDSRTGTIKTDIYYMDNGERKKIEGSFQRESSCQEFLTSVIGEQEFSRIGEDTTMNLGNMAQSGISLSDDKSNIIYQYSTVHGQRPDTIHKLDEAIERQKQNSVSEQRSM